MKAQDQIVRLTEELDAIKKLKTAGVIPPGMSAEEFAELLVEQMAPRTRRRFFAAFEERMQKAEAQDRIEQTRKR